MNTSKVTRIEVIDDSGRSYVLSTAHNVSLSLQDDDRTLKVFTNGKGRQLYAGLDPELAKGLSDHILAGAYRVLFGEDWKKGWNDASLAYEMRMILGGGDMPCRPFVRWMDTMIFLQDHI